MATKISGLPEVTNVSKSAIIPIVQEGTTSKATVNSILSSFGVGGLFQLVGFTFENQYFVTTQIEGFNEFCEELNKDYFTESITMLMGFTFMWNNKPRVVMGRAWKESKGATQYNFEGYDGDLKVQVSDNVLTIKDLDHVLELDISVSAGSAQFFLNDGNAFYERVRMLYLENKSPVLIVRGTAGPSPVDGVVVTTGDTYHLTYAGTNSFNFCTVYNFTQGRISQIRISGDKVNNRTIVDTDIVTLK